MEGREWIKETVELINDLEGRKVALEERADECEAKLVDLDRKIAAGRELILLYKSKKGLQ